MKKYIIVTTIFDPSPAVRAYAKIAENEGWTLLVVGDKKTPHEKYESLQQEFGNVRYYHPDEQEKRYPEYSKFLGWNCSSRRNLGFIEAYNCGAEVLALVDDDNIPLKGWGQNLGCAQKVNTGIYTNYKDEQTLAFDAIWPVAHNFYECDKNDNIPWHRGYPLELLHERAFKYAGQDNRQFMVQANLWLGNPDVDAIERLTMKFNDKPPFPAEALRNYTPAQLGWEHFDEHYTFTHQFSPFNSQNTFLAREAIPCFLLLREAGRVDDIWGSYLLQKELGPGNVCYGEATVWQERNGHDLMKDFADEIFGTMNVLKFLKGEFELPDNMKRHVEIYKKQFER